MSFECSTANYMQRISVTKWNMISKVRDKNKQRRQKRRRGEIERNTRVHTKKKRCRLPSTSSKKGKASDSK